MGTYFNNTELDGLWTRLVNATNNLIGYTGTGWYVTTDRPSANYISGDYFYFDGSPIGYDYSIEDQGTWSSPIYLPSLDTRTSIAIDYNGMTNTHLQYRTGSLSNTGIKGIHDALLSYCGLSHEKSPTTPGDYMKGIAVAARYYSNGSIINTESKNSLEEIVAMLESGDHNEYYCPVCSAPWGSQAQANSCTLTSDCPGNNPGYGHVCEYCGGDHYESDCPNYCSYCKEAYCDCVTSWCSQDERNTKWHCIDTTSNQYACNNCGWIKTIW